MKVENSGGAVICMAIDVLANRQEKLCSYRMGDFMYVQKSADDLEKMWI